MLYYLLGILFIREIFLRGIMMFMRAKAAQGER